MRRINTANQISPTEQMYTLNRINGLGNATGLGVVDDITAIVSTVVGAFKKLFGLFTKDPMRDIHIPAQNAAVAGFAAALNAIESKRVAGTLTGDDVNKAIYTITTIYTQFDAYTAGLARQYPQDASRYTAGASEVHALGLKIISDMKAQYAGITSGLPGISQIASSVKNLIITPTGGLSPLVLAAAGFFLLPKLLKR
jgi:hypothetical protein